LLKNVVHVQWFDPVRVLAGWQVQEYHCKVRRVPGTLC
jgi:hypothetical protein